MSKWSRQWRTRQHTGHGERPARDAQAPPTLTAELAAAELADAAHHTLRGARDAGVLCVADLVDGRFRTQPRTVDTAAGMVLAHGIDRAWAHGWLPEDIHQWVRRRLDADAEDLVRDVMAAAAERYPAGRIHRRWRDQLTGLDAAVWWPRDRPHLGEWLVRRGIGRAAALLRVIQLLALLMGLPTLPRILPAPGTATGEAAAAGPGVDAKILARVRALLAKAESTQFPEEAEALSAKAQELMTRYAFERAMVDAADEVPQLAGSRRMWLDGPYLSPKAHLVHVVGRANRCRSVSYDKFGFVALIGAEVDLDIVELLSTSLLVQATKAMMAEGSQVGWGGQSKTRSYRHSFLLAYASRIGERLRAANDTAAAPGVLPVLLERKQAVDDLYESMFTNTVTKSHSVGNAAGWGAGRAAADRADLGVNRDALVGGGP